MTAMLCSAICANIAQSGAALGVAIRTRSKTMRTAALSACVTAFFGITEPAIYGITLRYKKPFFCACAAAAITSGILGLLNSYATAIALPGILSLPVFNSEAGFVWVPVMVLASFVLAAIFTCVVGIDEKE